MSRGRDPAVLLIAAVLLLGPSLVLGNLLSHSSPQNLTWSEQFNAQFLTGVLYPRWLPDSFDGLGSVTFYFYSPIAFWVAALVSLLTLGTVSTSYCLSVATLLLLWASGLAMWAWLRPTVGSPRIAPGIALWGALAYMAAPYHLVDHYLRGAFAEFAAYAVLPLVMLAVRRIAERRRHGVLALAVAYAALPMAHLPTSLLISVTALPLYVLYRGWCLGEAMATLKFLMRCLAGGILGLGLAAIYLAPALGLQDWIPVDTFWQGGYRVENWFLLTPDRWPPPALDIMLILVSCAVAYGFASAAVLFVQVRTSGRAGWQSEPAFWGLLCLLCILLIAGALPWFWLLPFVAKVQFPWRLTIVIEFAAVSALCSASWAGMPRAAARVLAIVAVSLMPAVVILGAIVNARVVLSRANPDLPADLKQFLPADYPRKPDGGYAELGLEPLMGVPQIACAPIAQTCRASALPLGELAIEIDTAVPTTVVVRRFAYPFWRTEPPLPIAATQPLQLVAISVPEGSHTLRLVHARPLAERLGWWVSGVSLILLAAGTVLSRDTSARSRRVPPAR